MRFSSIEQWSSPKAMASTRYSKLVPRPEIMSKMCSHARARSFSNRLRPKAKRHRKIRTKHQMLQNLTRGQLLRRDKGAKRRRRVDAVDNIF